MSARDGYIGRAPGDSSVIIAKQTFEPTGVQTNFTFTSGYTVGYLDVYINGARQINASDYTASDGSTVGLTTYATSGDVLELVAYKAFNVATIDTAPGNLSVGGDLTVSGTSNVGVVTGGTYYGDGSNLTGLPGQVDLWNKTAAGINTAVSVGIGTTRPDSIARVNNTTILNAGIVTAYQFYGDGSNLSGISTAAVPGINTERHSVFNTINVSGIATFGADVSIAGTITYDDVTNVDSVGVITARSGINVTGGNSDFGDYSTYGTRIKPSNGIGIKADGNPAREVFHVTNTTDSSTKIQFLAGGDGIFQGRVSIAQTIAHAGDTNTNIQFPAADTITAETGGSERLRIDSTGNFGIGTSSPSGWGPALHLAGTDPAFLMQDTATAVDFFVINISSGLVSNWYDDAASWRIGTASALTGTSYNERMRIDSSGNMGIGESSPSSYDSGARNLVVGSTSDTGILIKAGTSSYSNIYFGDGTGSASYRGIVAYNHSGDSLRFGAAGSEAMRIDSSGRLLVGTTSADNAVSYADNLVIGTTSGDNGMTIVSGTGDAGSINFSDGSGANETKGIIQYHHSSDNLTFYVDSSERLRINSGGDVNITGICTATSFSGDGSGLSGVESWNQQDNWLYGGG